MPVFNPVNFFAGADREQHVAQLGVVRTYYARRGTKFYAAVEIAETALNLGKENAAVLIEDALWQYMKYTGYKDRAAFHFLTSALIYAHNNVEGVCNSCGHSLW